jgi:Outer membrane protein beta-barrel domain
MKSAGGQRIALALLVCAGLLTAATASAGGYFRRGTGFIAGGITNPTGDINEFLNTSGVIAFAVGRHVSPKMSMQVEWTHNWLSVDPLVLERANSDSITFDNAYSSLWSVTLNSVYRFNPGGDNVPWVTGGIGFYKRNVQITQNALVYIPPYWDPWWGWLGGGWVPGEVITGNRESGAFGYNIGFGIDMEIEHHTSLFLDVRFHHAFTEGIDTMVIPVMAGFRF